jgi:hypothetical protein
MFVPALPTAPPGSKQDRVPIASCLGTVDEVLVRKGCVTGLKRTDLESTVKIKEWLERQPGSFQSLQASTNVAFAARRFFTEGQPPPAGFTDSLLLPEERKALLKLFADSCLNPRCPGYSVFVQNEKCVSISRLDTHLFV